MPNPTTPIDTTQLDQGTDTPKTARASLHDAVVKLNAIITSAGQALSFLQLDANAKVPTSSLTSAVDHDAIQPNAVEADNILNGQINFLHLKATITNNPSPPTGGTNGDLHFIYD